MAEEKQIKLSGRIDSGSAPEMERSLRAQIIGDGSERLLLDAAGLEYISSAGLRVLLRLRKASAGLRLINVNPEVYEVLDMTGFTQMMEVEKGFRSVSVEGCEEIGHGANGSVYRFSDEIAIKVYREGSDLEDIRHEREMAKLALVLGLPTAISYDVVKVGERYGTVFELLNAQSFSAILAGEPDKLDWCVAEFTDLLKKIHDTEVPAGKLPDARETALGWVEEMRPWLPAAPWEKLRRLVEAVPPDLHMIHGDYHTKNLQVQNGEVLLIDMDTLSAGNRIFELGSIYNSFLGFYELDHKAVERFQGFSYETSEAFWRRFLARYLDTDCPHKLREVEDKARVLGYTRLIRRACRLGLQNTEAGRRDVENWTRELLELLERVDSLCFSKDELILPAETEALEEVQDFVGRRVGEDCGPKTRMQLELAVEEIFVNIASYAYAPGSGPAAVRVELEREPPAVAVSFRDRGVPYDPLAREDPDVNLLAQERREGGLGIFLTKQVMDEVRYEYREGQNVLTMKKLL